MTKFISLSNFKKELCLHYRIALTGSDKGGISVFEIMTFLGKEETLKRINNYLEFLKSCNYL